MSKLTKFLSIGMDIIKGQEEKVEELGIDQDLDFEKMNQILLWFEGLCDHQKISYTQEQQVKEKGIAEIQINDENSNGILAQVKFFPLKKSESADNYNRVNGKINMIREITDWNGRLHTLLPVGEYYVEISKGSEYELVNTKFTVCQHETNCLVRQLIPIVNLKETGWYSGDLHHHSIYSSPVYGGTDSVIESPAEVCQSMMAMGASFGALSDHHNTFNHKEWGNLKSDSFTPILSKEISTSNGHVMSLGVEDDVIYQIPNGENRTDDLLRGEFIRVTDQIKELGGLPQINHPRDLSKAISWNPKYYDLLPIFQTMEIWNGSNPMIQGSTNYNAFLLWQELLEQGNYIPATTGSDTHNILANDYHEIFDKLNWLARLIKDRMIETPEGLKKETDFFLKIYEEVMPLLEKWAETNLSSACVRTFTQVKGEVTQEKILNSLRHGHSFLTNGPILIPEIDGKIPGDTVTKKQLTVDVQLKLLANRPLKTLTIYTNGKQKIDIILESSDTKTGKYDYSQTLPNISIQNVNWMYFIVADDCTNMAITNPIFFE